VSKAVVRRSAKFDFEGAVVLVGGGGTGIGKAIAQMFIDAGAHVVVAGRREAPLKAFCAENGATASYVILDTTKKEDCVRAIETVAKTRGSLDVLVINALAATVGPFEDQDEAQLRAPTDTMVVGAAFLAQAAMPHLEASQGCVVSISSAISRVVPYPSRGSAMYAAAKAGLNHLIRQLAAEYGPKGVRFNTVAPGATRTDAMNMTRPDLLDRTAAQTPLGRLGEPDEVASVVLFLASDAAKWVTGETITASGGMMMPAG